MGAAFSTATPVPILATPAGAALYVAGAVIGIACGSANLVGMLRELTEVIRYCRWSTNVISFQTNPELYWNLMALVDLFTYAHMTGKIAKNGEKKSFNTNILTQKGHELVEETGVKKITHNGVVVSETKRDANQDQTMRDPQRYGKIVTAGPTTKTTTIEITDKKNPDGTIVQETVETTLTKTTTTTNIVYTVAVSAEFEFTLDYQPDPKLPVVKYTYCIRTLKSQTFGSHPDIYIYTRNSQPDAIAILLQLEVTLPRDGKGNFDPTQVIFAR